MYTDDAVYPADASLVPLHKLLSSHQHHKPLFTICQSKHLLHRNCTVHYDGVRD
eukprot:m.78811 g.78811  ORF g.78811 m.78811 type:complete len:54 (+) comp16251_c1_seq1:71-232(+)